MQTILITVTLLLCSASHALSVVVKLCSFHVMTPARCQAFPPAPEECLLPLLQVPFLRQRASAPTPHPLPLPAQHRGPVPGGHMGQASDIMAVASIGVLGGEQGVHLLDSNAKEVERQGCRTSQKSLVCFI